MENEKSSPLDPGVPPGGSPRAPLGPEVPLVKHGLRVHPQRTRDPRDPLNWSTARKHVILGIVMWLYFLFTYITTTTVPAFPEIQTLYGISYAQVNWTVAIPALGLAVGPLVWSSLADKYGRRVIFIAGTVIGLAASCGAAVAANYGGYMAARFFQGFGSSPGATVGMAIVNDLFFDYERGQKLGYWVLAIDTGLLVGPLVGGFMDLVDQFWIDWLTALLFAGLLLVELLFLPETLYPRTLMRQQLPWTGEGQGMGEVGDVETGERPERPERPAERPAEKSGDGGTSGAVAIAPAPAPLSVPRTTSLPFLNLRPVPGMTHPQPWDSLLRFLLTWKYPVVVLSVGIYCFGWYWWILSLITMIPSAYATYSPQAQGLLFLGLILGTLFSEFLCSGRLSDYLVLRLARRNDGVRVAEMRLWLAYPAATLIGLIIWGISIDKGYHWIVGQVAFFLFATGIQMGNTVVTSYIVDAYPLQSMAVITFYSVLLNLSAFIDPFFIAPWVASSGYTWCFAAQGIITFFASVPVIALLHVYGARLRQWSGAPTWVDPEYDNS